MVGVAAVGRFPELQHGGLLIGWFASNQAQMRAQQPGLKRGADRNGQRYEE
jgi:hypothetical protein